MKKNFFIFLCVAILMVVLNINQNLPKQATALSEYKSMVVIEQNSKRVLDQYNKDERLPMASTTKIMTALVVLKHVPDLDQIVSIDDKAVGIEGTSMYLRKNEKLTVRELLSGMLLPSGNDAATALALFTSKNMHEFAKLMNEEAKNLGLQNTNFQNSHGLDEKDHYTSAYDLAVIASEAMKYSAFSDIVSQPSIQVKGAGGDQGNIRYLKNKNKFLKLCDGATGVKTGFTDSAGRCLVASCTRGKMNLICVVLNCPNMFECAAKLVEKAYKNFNYVELLQPYNCYRKIDVVDGKQNEVKLYTCRGFGYPLTQEESEKIVYKYSVPEKLKAPINKEDCVGYVEIFLDENLLFEEKIYTMDEIKSVEFFNNFEEILKNWY